MSYDFPTPSWDQWFMTFAYLASMKSKDEKTHIGACVVGPDKEIRSLGYNSFPRGIDDNRPERQERPEKYYFMAHAERNSVYNAARMGLSLKGCTMYTQGMPCTDCAIAVIQSGITEVVLHRQWGMKDQKKWLESAFRSTAMLEEAGVKVRFYDGPIIEKILGYQDGQILENI